VKCGDEKITRLLVLNKAALDAKDSEGLTALVHATCQGNVAMMECLLEQGAPLDLQDTAGGTALHHAIKIGNRTRELLVLLKARADADVQDNDQRTPLMLAAEEGQLQEVHVLLQHGAGAGMKDANGKTARGLAEAKGHQDVLTVMSAAGVTT
jgi:ankyrin repeat protein